MHHCIVRHFSDGCITVLSASMFTTALTVSSLCVRNALHCWFYYVEFNDGKLDHWFGFAWCVQSFFMLASGKKKSRDMILALVYSFCCFCHQLTMFFFSFYAHATSVAESSAGRACTDTSIQLSHGLSIFSINILYLRIVAGASVAFEISFCLWPWHIKSWPWRLFDLELL